MRHTGTQTIATERLTLRRFTIEDAENMYYNWACDPEVTKYLTWQPHKSVEETTEILQQWEEDYSKNDFYQWAIEVNDIEQPIGSISVVSLDEDVQSAERGYPECRTWLLHRKILVAPGLHNGGCGGSRSISDGRSRSRTCLGTA